MELKELQKTWDELGRTDPFWAILADPAKRDGAWDKDEFFKTGEDEIAHLLQYIDSLGRKITRERALDFGCGVGRLTQALCRYFQEGVGIDIAPSMIELANTYNQYGAKCKYYLNESDDLALFDNNSFNLIYSVIVLQHIAPIYSKKYIKEFLRLLTPGGLAVFHLPSELLPIKQRLLPGQSAIAEALPHAAFKYRLQVMNPPTTLTAGTQLTLRVQVTNESEVCWPALGAVDGRYHIRVGNHWLDEQKNIVVNDDGRGMLSKDVGPTETIELPLVVTAPEEPGPYVLELDMVQEGVTWFKQRGAETVSFAVDVKRSGSRLLNLYNRILQREPVQAPVKKANTIWGMYGVPKSEVIDVVERNGGEVLNIQESTAAGEGWLGFMYYITK